MGANAYTIVTAMPPTVGHDALCEFAKSFGELHTVVATQPHEPMVRERVSHFKFQHSGFSNTHHYSEVIEQNPETPGFREMWAGIMKGYGLGPGDFIVTSEPYGQWIAEMTGSEWVPFDIDRKIVPAKAESIRNDYITNWQCISPEFRKRHLQRRVTTFGAESCGKTTLANQIVDALGGRLLHEWARPYLEAVGPVLSVDKMDRIWKGQRAIQWLDYDSPLIVQDTDLFSTLGYWHMYSPETVTSELYFDAHECASDLYILCPSDIPFEADALRYGGTKRESSDQYWIDLLEDNNLNYVIYDREDGPESVFEEIDAILPSLAFDRGGY